ncbi:hypothetical protein [Pseudoxanthomonas suwonensis]
MNLRTTRHSIETVARDGDGKPTPKESVMSQLPFLSRLPIAAAMAAFLVAPAALAFDSGSTGTDGELHPASNIDIQLPESGVLNYTTVNIPSGVTVRFLKNSTNTPVYLLASGNVTIAGTVDIRGGDAAATGTYGDGVLGDDGNPGEGGPGGYSGGRGGRADAQQRVGLVRGGAGLGPGGGPGGIEGGNNCTLDGSYYPYIGVGAGTAPPPTSAIRRTTVARATVLRDLRTVPTCSSRLLVDPGAEADVAVPTTPDRVAVAVAARS